MTLVSMVQLEWNVDIPVHQQDDGPYPLYKSVAHTTQHDNSAFKSMKANQVVVWHQNGAKEGCQIGWIRVIQCAFRAWAGRCPCPIALLQSCKLGFWVRVE